MNFSTLEFSATSSNELQQRENNTLRSSYRVNVIFVEIKVIHVHGYTRLGGGGWREKENFEEFRRSPLLPSSPSLVLSFRYFDSTRVEAAATEIIRYLIYRNWSWSLFLSPLYLPLLEDKSIISRLFNDVTLQVYSPVSQIYRQFF